MNIKSILIAVSLTALGASAADVSYPYTPGNANPGAGVTIAFDGDNITSITATPTDSGTITLTGGTPTFAAGATITVNAPGTLAFGGKVTTLGALTINRGDGAYLVWSSDTALTEDLVAASAFSGITVGESEVEVARVVSTGPTSDSASCGQQGLWTHISDLSSGFFLCNKVTAAYVFSARLQVYNGQVRCRTCIRSPRFGTYPGEEAEWATDNLYNRWVPNGTGRSDHSERGLYAKSTDSAAMKGTYLGTASDLGFRKIILRRTNVPGGAMSVRFAGGAALGGATTVGAGMEAVVVATSSNVATLSNAISGDGDFKIEAASSGSVATLTCDMSGLVGGKFTIEGTAGSVATVTANSGTKFPYGGEVHVDDKGFLKLAGAEASTWKPSLFVHSGGTLQTAVHNQIGNRQLVVLDGGTYNHSSGNNYVNYLTLSNATTTGSASFRTGLNLVNGNPQAQFQYWRVIGTEPTVVRNDYGVLMYGGSSVQDAVAKSCAFRLDVADVTSEGDGVDCTLNRINCDSGTYPWFWFEKYGAGTLKVTGNSKPLRMTSKLYNGTLLLAGNDIMTNAVQLLGGNFAIDAGKTNALGNLKATTNATLTVGAGGSMSFASFTPGAGLAEKAIVIDAPMEGDSVRIGRNGSGLAAEHCKYFRWKDATDATKLWRVEQDANGYLHPLIKGTMISIR